MLGPRGERGLLFARVPKWAAGASMAQRDIHLSPVAPKAAGVSFANKKENPPMARLAGEVKRRITFSD
jgi:hypothetical protein